MGVLDVGQPAVGRVAHDGGEPAIGIRPDYDCGQFDTIAQEYAHVTIHARFVCGLGESDRVMLLYKHSFALRRGSCNVTCFRHSKTPIQQTPLCLATRVLQP